jgi:hypothetical protein
MNGGTRIKGSSLMTTTIEIEPHIYGALEFLLTKGRWLTNYYHPAAGDKDFLYKRDTALKFFKEGEFQSFLSIVEKPYRFHALANVLHVLDRNGGDETRAASLIRWVWENSENIWQSRAHWKDLWCELDEPYMLMNSSELATLVMMPDPLIVYRGASGRNPRPWSGLSWTIDRKRAMAFGLRDCHPEPFLLSGRIRKKHIFAYFDSEEEVVLLPRYVRDRKLERLERVSHEEVKALYAGEQK